MRGCFRALGLPYLGGLFLAAAQPGWTAEPVEAFDPPALYLTWQRDPAHTMTVHWHHIWREGYRDPVLEYRRMGQMKWTLAVGTWHPAPFSERHVNTVELTGLQADTLYEFRLGTLLNNPEKLEFGADSATYRFRTLPSRLTKPLTLVVGGDIYRRPEVVVKMHRQAAAADPAFAVVGGDIAYADGRPDRASQWEGFFELWKQHMRTSEGHLIPIVVAIGNHEAHAYLYPARRPGSIYERSPNRAPYFYSFFSFPGRPGYNVLDVGDYLSLVVLDSGHTAAIEGSQTAWLARVLSERRRVRYLIPLYHVPAYPSVRPYDGTVSQEIRRYWVPLFERAKIRFVFEHHDHAYKRTKPLLDGRENSRGVYYLGDGAWGVQTQPTAPSAQRWYLERAESRNHIYVVTLGSSQASFKAVDPDGVVFDEFRIAPAAR